MRDFNVATVGGGNIKILMFVIFCSLAFALLMTVPSTFYTSQSSSIVYVDTDGSGDYNCDGVDDHLEINQALAFVRSNDSFTTVHLNGPNTYIINDTLLISSDTVLEGDLDAVLTIPNEAGWVRGKGLIENYDDHADNITIRGFEIDGNRDNQSEVHGLDYYTALDLEYIENVTVNNMYIHDNLGDGISYRAYYGGDKNLIIHNNTFYRCGHEAIYTIYTSGIYIRNNHITANANSGIRLDDPRNVVIEYNTIRPYPYDTWSNAGIQIDFHGSSEYVCENIEISYNVINGSRLSGITMSQDDKVPRNLDDATGVHIHHNIITATGTHKKHIGTAGIFISGWNNTLIENNVIDGNYKDGIAHDWLWVEPYGSGYVTIVRNNIITNTLPHHLDTIGTGYGINNNLSSTHSFVLENNCVWNNTKGNYRNAASTTDIHVNPLFADPNNLDYHLKSAVGRWSDGGWVFDDETSQLINAGYSGSDYSNEPAPNGGRVNIGVYGNTAEASKGVLS
jgi:hypothetical protein